MTAVYIERLISICGDIESIWLIGSRANGPGNSVSDWDYIVMADRATLDLVRSRMDLHERDIDLLIVYDQDRFTSAFGQMKCGSLSGWCWTQINEECAKYKGVKWVDDEIGAMGTWQTAVRVFCRRSRERSLE